jgi:HlyD family secretion protein
VKLDNTHRAPAAGVAGARREAGDLQPGKRLFLLAADGETQLVANVDEKNLRLVREGLQAMAAPTYPGVPATVFPIGPGVDSSAARWR